MQRGFFTRFWVIGYIVGALVAALGVFVMFQEESFLRFFVVLLGLFVTISAVVQLIGLSSYQLNLFFQRTTLVRAIVSIILGLCAVILPLASAKVSWMLLLYTMATVLGLSAIITIIDAILTAKGGDFRSSLLLDGIFSLVVSILLFAFPDKIGTVLLKLVGLVIIIAGLSLVVLASRGRSLSKRLKALTIEGEGEIIP